MSDDARPFLWLAIAAFTIAAYNAFRNARAGETEVAGYGGGTPGSPIGNALTAFDPMSVSPSGENFIKTLEGLDLVERNDEGHPEIGYGHDIVPGENIPSRITRAFAQALFTQDMDVTARVLNNSIKVGVTQNQFDALASLEYNIGASAFVNSTLLRLLNSGNYSGAAAEFGKWIHAGGVVNDGLVRRREKERQLFES